MLKALNVVSVTLFVALVAVVPSALVIRIVPDFWNPGLQRIAVAAWISAIISWYVARAMQDNERQQGAQQAQSKQSSRRATVGLAVGFLAVATGIAVALHFFGDRLIVW